MSRRGFVYADVIATIGIIALLYAGVAWYSGRSLSRARQESCVQNLRQIAIALHTYALDYGGAFPDQEAGLRSLWDMYAADKAVFVCPQVELETSHMSEGRMAPARVGDALDVPIDYAYRGGLYSDDLPSLAVAMDYLAHQHNGGANVLYLDGHVGWRLFAEPDVDTRQLLSSGALDVLPHEGRPQP
jgi:prepilin-type processing-associated H-X9-DG protein